MGLALVFWVEQQSFGLPLEAVGRVVRAVAVTPVPHAPAIVCGVVDVAGSIVPVVDFRRAVGLAPREMALDDHLLFARVGGQTLALWVDRAGEVVPWRAAELLPPAVPGSGLSGGLLGGLSGALTGALSGIARSPSGLILILDLAAFLSPEAIAALALAADHA